MAFEPLSRAFSEIGVPGFEPETSPTRMRRITGGLGTEMRAVPNRRSAQSPIGPHSDRRVLRGQGYAIIEAAGSCTADPMRWPGDRRR